MVVGSGRWQIPLIRAFQTMGCEVTASGPYATGPGLLECDDPLELDLRDIGGHVRHARRRGVAAVATDQTDRSVLTVAEVAQALGIPGIGARTARDFTDKYAMRLMASRCQVHQPEFRLCSEPGEAEQFALGRETVVVKARDSQGGKGTFIVERGRDLHAAFSESVGQSSLRGVLVEDFIEGTEFSANGFKGRLTEGRHETLAIGRKTHFRDEPGLMESATYCPVDGSEELRLIREVNDAFMEKSGLSFGQTHVEYILCEGRPFLVEAAARGGGSGTSSHVVPAVSGVDTVSAYAAESLGDQSHGQVSTVPQSDSVVHLFARFGRGRLEKVDGLERARSVPGVILVESVHPPGTLLGQQVRERHLNVIAGGLDEESAMRAAEEAVSLVQATVSPGDFR